MSLLAVLGGEDGARAVGDITPLDFGEDDLESRLRHEVARAPKGRLLWMKADPSLAHGPFVRTADSLWVGRSGGSGGSPRHAQLVELDAQGHELRIHDLGFPWGPDPTFGSLGSIFGYKDGRHPVAWSPSGNLTWQGGFFREARFLAADLAGGVFVVSQPGTMRRLDPKGQQIFSATLGSGLTGAPLVLADGRTLSCLAPSGTLLALDGAGKALFRDEQARCTATPALTPTGVLMVSTDGGLRRQDLRGRVLGTHTLPGRLGPALLRPDGSVVVASSNGRVAMLSPAGRILWSFPLGKAGPPPPVHPSPTGELVVISSSGHVLALDPRGRLLWSYPVPSPRPAVWVRLDGAVLVLSPGDGLRLVAPPLKPMR